MKRFRFTRLELANWRNFRAVSLPLRERMFFVGPNAAGKTNLLDAFKFFRDVARVTEFVTQAWSPPRASRRSDSLRRARVSLRALASAWRSYVERS